MGLKTVKINRRRTQSASGLFDPAAFNLFIEKIGTQFQTKSLLMKLLFTLVAVVSVLLFWSCKKSANESVDYYMNMDIDGKRFSFNDSLSAVKSTGAPELVLFASGKTSGRAGLLFSSSTTGTYVNSYDTAIKKKIYQFTVTAIVAYVNGTPVPRLLMRPAPSVSNSISTTITNVNSTYIEGTFSGALNDGSTLATISNGRFRVPFR